MRLLDPSGRLLAHHLPAEDEIAGPEIDRGQLRELLLGSLADGTVHWGRTLESVRGPADGPRTLTFADGTIEEADLVIGADGAYSRVRAAVSPAKPGYIGVSILEAWFHDMETAHPELSELVGQGAPTSPTASAACSRSATAAGTCASTSSSGSAPTGSSRAGCAPVTPKASARTCWPSSRAGRRRSCG